MKRASIGNLTALAVFAGLLQLGCANSDSTIVDGSGGSVIGSGGKATGSGGEATGSGGKATGSGGKATGSGGKATGSGGKATGSGGKATGSGGAAGTTAGSGGKTGSGGDNFSFFVTSQTRLFALAKAFNGSTKGFGGDLRYGETGAGAGLRGADKICAAIAEQAAPGAGSKTWRAFLSVTASGSGTGSQVNAIDRIGAGPWYDRLGRLFANDISELKNTRPTNANATIKNDFPNEDGVPNHAPEGTEVDNHDFITGSNDSGQLYGDKATCKDWTDATLDYQSGYHPRVGHSWPRTFGWGGGGGGGGMDPMAHWISSLDESGCLPGWNTATGMADGPPGTDGIIGSGGGYGGFYCFAILNP